jgi:probable rRNA maturation factor
VHGLQITVANQQSTLVLDKRRLAGAVRRVLRGAGLQQATVSVAVVDDRTIHDLNRRFLGHDYPTDVLSFVLEQADGYLEGELVVSADTAVAAAAQFGWTAGDELLLYVVHGALHLVGYDDQSAGQRAAMRAEEREQLRHFGLEARYRRPPVAVKIPKKPRVLPGVG